MTTSVKTPEASEILTWASDIEMYPTYVPPENINVGTIEPNFYCRGYNSKREKYCKQRAGHRTDHPGEGRCAWHGKGGVLKHGRYSKVSRSSLREHLERIQDEGGDRADLTDDVDMLRALAADFIDRYDDILEALISWNSAEYIQANAQERKARPQALPDITSVGKIISDAAKVADKMHAQEHRDAIPKRDFFRIQDAMAEVVANAIRGVGHILGEDNAGDLITQISNKWAEIQL